MYLLVLGAVHSYQYVHKCTKGTLFLTPPPPPSLILKVYNNKRYVIKVIIIYVLERKITDLKIRGAVG